MTDLELRVAALEQSIPNQTAYVTTGQAARLLGYSRSHVLRLIKDGVIPAIQIRQGGHRLVPLAWIEQQTNPEGNQP